LAAQEKENKVFNKLQRKIDKYERENRFLRKRSEDRQAIEEVFDKRTKIALYNLMKDKSFQTLNGVVKTGKEARIYWGQTNNEESIAVKIYLTFTSEFRNRLKYIDGDPRFRAVKGISKIVELWARKEFRNLNSAIKAGVRVPKPIFVKKNILGMEFIGKDGVSAPTLKEIEVTKSDYLKILTLIRKLYVKGKLVHSDLSEYNIFKWKGEIILFDMGSAVNIKHPNSTTYLQRDINNINQFFEKRGIKINNNWVNKVINK